MKRFPRFRRSHLPARTVEHAGACRHVLLLLSGLVRFAVGGSVQGLPNPDAAGAVCPPGNPLWPAGAASDRLRLPHDLALDRLWTGPAHPGNVCRLLHQIVRGRQAQKVGVKSCFLL